MKYNKDQIHEIVEVFYQNQFKTFYINSNDGEKFIKPLGIFISLGMATSMKSLENIKNILNNYGDLKAELAEIKSTKVSGQFMNLINKLGDDVCQFRILDSDIPNNCFNREQALNYIETTPGINKVKWNSLIEKIDNSDDGWEVNLIQIIPELDDIRVFRKFINYNKNSETGEEFRIGIYVKEC